MLHNDYLCVNHITFYGLEQFILTKQHIHVYIYLKGTVRFESVYS